MCCLHSAREYHVCVFTEFLRCPPKLDWPKLIISPLIVDFFFVSLFHLVTHPIDYLKLIPKLVLAVLFASARHVGCLTENADSTFGTVLWKGGKFSLGESQVLKQKRFQASLYHSTLLLSFV